VYGLGIWPIVAAPLQFEFREVPSHLVRGEQAAVDRLKVRSMTNVM